MITQQFEVPCNAKAAGTCLEDKQTSSLSSVDFRITKKQNQKQTQGIAQNAAESAANHRTSFQASNLFTC